MAPQGFETWFSPLLLGGLLPGFNLLVAPPSSVKLSSGTGVSNESSVLPSPLRGLSLKYCRESAVEFTVGVVNQLLFVHLR